MIKKYNQLFENQVEPDWEEEPDDTEYQIIKWKSPILDNDWTGDNNNIYILQEFIDKDLIILGNDYKHRVHNIEGNYDALTIQELEDHIYNNQCKINVFKDGGNRFLSYFWEDLPIEIKNKL